jgi:hypothetical protein
MCVRGKNPKTQLGALALAFRFGGRPRVPGLPPLSIVKECLPVVTDTSKAYSDREMRRARHVGTMRHTAAKER